MKWLYSLLILIAIIVFVVFVLPWLMAFFERHAMTFIYIGAVVVLFIGWVLIHAAFFSDSNKE